MVVMTRAKREDEESAAKKATRRSSHFFPSWTKKPKVIEKENFNDKESNQTFLYLPETETPFLHRHLL